MNEKRGYGDRYDRKGKKGKRKYSDSKLFKVDPKSFLCNS